MLDSDAALIQEANDGNLRVSFDLVECYEETVQGLSFKACRNRDKAEEALQDTFINAGRRLGQFDGRSKLSPWFHSTVTNYCLMKHRKRTLDEEMVLPGWSTDER